MLQMGISEHVTAYDYYSHECSNKSRFLVGHDVGGNIASGQVLLRT